MPYLRFLTPTLIYSESSFSLALYICGMANLCTRTTCVPEVKANLLNFLSDRSRLHWEILRSQLAPKTEHSLLRFIEYCFNITKL